MDFHATVLQQTEDGGHDRSRRRSHGAYTPFHQQQAAPGQSAFASATSPGLPTAPGPPRQSSFLEGVMNEVGGVRRSETERGSTASSRHSTNAGGAGAGGLHGQQHVGAIGEEAQTLTWKAVGPKDANANELNTTATNTANANVTVIFTSPRHSIHRSIVHTLLLLLPLLLRPQPIPFPFPPTTTSPSSIKCCPINLNTIILGRGHHHDATPATSS
ncbi:hypothetical protein PG999_011941 [Apiospora kogelbergensis]|uniref:Uncharacterized protein n=1 Tax=Apiospora kogelbergensis TaxID=1337665 RepID=A0AAW0QFR7_9PEZI